MSIRWVCMSLALALFTGCGTDPDPRPVDLETLTLTVLAPSCGQVQCHSSSTWTAGYAFDTVQAAKVSLRKGCPELLGTWNNTTVCGDFDEVLFEEQSMPPDSPWSDGDVALWDAWIAASKPGI